MFNSVLIVCVGNICRSPTGERLLKRELSEIKISSAGIHAVVGAPADNMAELVAEEHGLSLKGHIARQLTSELCRENDLILVMENKHIEAVCKLAPEARGKIMLYAHWLKRRDIGDPYKQSKEAYKLVYEILEDAAKHWINALKR
ncbi:arsenate reductase/protein-tyrosine-phosphatase family protein [Serratia fonticola]|jgi:protein-tyrosine phosphatase|uniref:arsenate reductase/protein-tyrosine-phosphatase family protein n=1 Tax=Serratia fonticola TaxID=47917 RepID=UPI0021B844B9|nr:protein tyrosine phosphatase [Serratia fonticola]